MSFELPIKAVLPDVLAKLETNNRLVLVAPPGAGKTTGVPLALLNAPWRADKTIIMLEPRRVAARAAARQLARLLGEREGETVGYRMRMESKVSAKTRILVVTEGVFTRMILDDPELSQVAAVIFDEFHERSLEAELGLALARDAQAGLRDDLKLIVMSATLDGDRIASALDGCPVVESQGRAFPVETRYRPTAPRARIEDEMATAVFDVLQSESGSLLCFLPGQAEILRTKEKLAKRVGKDVDLVPLYGALDGKQQDSAIKPADQGRRKVVLATNIAESALTIEGVRVVVDSGLARIPVVDPQTGMTRLTRQKISKASADQRRGRAGRTEAGICVRLWGEGQNAGMVPFDPPEIETADLTALVLALADWGVSSPETLTWLDEPPAIRWKEAQALLSRMGALKEGTLTDHGRKVAKLPLHPRLAHMVVTTCREASERASLAVEISALLSEPGKARQVDARERLRNLRQGRDGTGKRQKQLAEAWAKRAGFKYSANADVEDIGAIASLAFPERIAEQRGVHGDKTRFRMASGRIAELDNETALANEPYITVLEAMGRGANDIIFLGAPISLDDLRALHKENIKTQEEVSFREGTGALQAEEVKYLGKVVLSRKRVSNPSAEAIERALLGLLRKTGVTKWPWSDNAGVLRARVAFLKFHQPSDGWPDLSNETLLDTMEEWLLPFLAGKTNLKQVDAALLGNALSGLIPWDKVKILDDLAPEQIALPKTKARVDYSDPERPTVAQRAQFFYGLKRHPAVLGGSLPITLHLLSPAQRPVQVTQDIASFWEGSWKEVRAEMRSRYPKHDWPENP